MVAPNLSLTPTAASSEAAIKPANEAATPTLEAASQLDVVRLVHLSDLHFGWADGLRLGFRSIERTAPPPFR